MAEKQTHKIKKGYDIYLKKIFSISREDKNANFKYSECRKIKEWLVK